MSVYPAIAGELGLSDRQAGFLIGASVHDVAQAIGGGYAFSDAAGSYATSSSCRGWPCWRRLCCGQPDDWGGGHGEAKAPLWRRLSLPWFIAAFLATVALNSLLPCRRSSGASALRRLERPAAARCDGHGDALAHGPADGHGLARTVPVIAATLASFAASLGFAVTLL